MTHQALDQVLDRIARDYADDIAKDSVYYLEVDIGKKAEALGYGELKEKFRDVNAIVPVKRPAGGMRVMIDGRTFVNYAQFPSGIAVPGYVAKETRLPHHRYEAGDSMVLGFQ